MSADSFLSYRNVVSQVYRLTMLIAAKRHEKAADAFDAFLDDLAQIVAGPSTVADIRNVDSFLERDPPSPRTPPVNEADAHPVRIIIHETDDAVSTAAVRVEKLGSVGSLSEEEEGEALDEKEEELTLLEMATHPEEGEAVEETEVEATEEVVDDGEVIEETEEEVVENDEVVEETEEVEVTEEETEEVEATEEETEEVEVTEEETKEVEANEEETEETTEEETEEVEETEEETEEVEETEEETEEVEATEEETEETTEEEEEATEEEEGDGGLEAITIGKVQYYLDSSTNHVFAFVSDDEAGEYVGKMVNNKLVRG